MLKKQEESNDIICKLEADVSSLKLKLAYEESSKLVLEEERVSMKEELQRATNSNSSLLQQIEILTENLKHLSSDLVSSLPRCIITLIFRLF